MDSSTLQPNSPASIHAGREVDQPGARSSLFKDLEAAPCVKEEAKTPDQAATAAAGFGGTEKEGRGICFR